MHSEVPIYGHFGVLQGCFFAQRVSPKVWRRLRFAFLRHGYVVEKAKKPFPIQNKTVHLLGTYPIWYVIVN